MAGGEIRTGIRLVGDASGLTPAFTAGQKAVHDLDQEIVNANKNSGKLTEGLDGVGKQLGRVISIAAGWQFGKQVMSTADEMTTLHSRLKLVTSSASELSFVQLRLFEISQAGRGVYSELGALYAQTARSTADLNISQERLLNLTQTITQAMAISGGSIDSQRAAIVQLSQGLASGTLRGEELNSVMEQTPRLASAIAQGMGVSLGQLRALGADGKLTALAIVDALEKAAPALQREFEQVTPTISQAFQTVQNSSSLFIAEFDKATGSSKALSGGLTTVANGISSVAESINKNERAWATLGALVGGAAAVATLAAGWGAVAGGLARVGAVLAANPLIATLMGAGGLLNAAMNNQVAYNATEGAAQQKVLALQARIATLDAQIARGGNQSDINRLQADRARVGKSLSAAQTASGGFSGSGDAAEQFRAMERNSVARNDAAAMFPGAKPLEEVRKYAKLALDVQREAYDQSVDIAKSYQNRIKLASTDDQRLALTQEMNARLLQVDKDAKREMKSIAEQGAADAKQLSESQFSEKKARLELTASIERQAMDQQQRTNEQLYKLNLIDVDTYYERKKELGVQDLAITERLTQAELKQAQAVAAAARKQDDKLQAQARVLGLERELVDLATKRAAIEAEPADQRALRLRAQEQEFRDYNYREQRKSAEDGYGQASQLYDETARIRRGLIKDPNKRDRADLEEELRLRKAIVDSIADADARELATQRFNEFAVAKNDELEERLKPGWQRMVDGWGDSTVLMRDSFNSSMDGILRTGEDAFAELASKGKLSISSLVDFGLAELGRLAFRAMVGGLGGGKGGGGGGFGGLLASLFGGGSSTPDASAFMIDEWAGVGLFHSGGILGGSAPGRRSVDSSVFRGAPRFHTGGIMGDEIPIVGKRGEGVFTKEQMANLAPAGSGAAPVVNIYTPPGMKAETTSRVGRNGAVSLDVIIRQVEDALADNVSAGTGSLGSAVAGRYGLKEAVI